MVRSPVQQTCQVTMQASGSLLDATIRRVEARTTSFQLYGRVHGPDRSIDQDYERTSRVLGDGSNGDVFLGISRARTGGNRTVAVKTLELDKVQPWRRADMLAELEVLLSTDHPSIVRLFDVYESRGQLHLVMECLLGGELFHKVREVGQFQEAEARSVLRQILSALAYLHAHGIAHRDVKIENFMFDTRGSQFIKLIDFGLSALFDGNKQLRGKVGTAEYVAPEVLEGSYTESCDLWSVGVVAYILLSGLLPWSSKVPASRAQMMNGKYNMESERWHRVPASAKDFVRRLLRVDPQNRLSAQAALNHPWLEEPTQSPKDMDNSVLEALCAFSEAPKFQRCCMSMAAWCLTSDEEMAMREVFLALDTQHRGAITVYQLQTAIAEKFDSSSADSIRLQSAIRQLPSQQNILDGASEIPYSDFLAAMTASKFQSVSIDSMRAVFRKFDDGSGQIRAAGLRRVVGASFEGCSVESMIQEASPHKDSVSFGEFGEYLTRASVECRSRRGGSYTAAESMRSELKDLRECCIAEPPLSLYGATSPGASKHYLKKQAVALRISHSNGESKHSCFGIPEVDAACAVQ